MNTFSLEEVAKFIKEFGIGQGLLILIIILFLFFLFKHTSGVYRKLIEAKDAEIKRIVADNKEFRIMFSQMIVEKMEIEIPNE